MSKKRRVFDIEFDATALEPEAAAPVPAGTEADARRGPMATAIGENAAALADRQAAEAAIRAENDRLAHAFVALKKSGLIVDLVPLDQVRMSKLTRDRVAKRDPELDELKSSIQAVGLSNPIRVEEVGDGEYELVQGFRRLSAYRELHAETGDPAYARIPAGLMARGARLAKLYQRMVDENLIRRDISFAEMAQLAWAYKREETQEDLDIAEAVDRLYASAGRQKRSYIKHFAELMRLLGNDLAHAEAIPRALGLQLVKMMDEDSGLAGRIRAVLANMPDRDADAELGLLRDVTKPAKAGGGQAPAKASVTPPAATTAKTTIRLARPDGLAKCVASDGRVEVQFARDFSALDRRKLEQALRAFLDSLEG
jgi:ParB family transcriptional regulator, chromosome partitioning protein